MKGLTLGSKIVGFYKWRSCFSSKCLPSIGWREQVYCWDCINLDLRSFKERALFLNHIRFRFPSSIFHEREWIVKVQATCLQCLKLKRFNLQSHSIRVSSLNLEVYSVKDKLIDLDLVSFLRSVVWEGQIYRSGYDLFS